MRIFTGAALPDGADTIIIQEKVRVEQGRIHLDLAQVKRGDHVRGEGSEIRKGDLALQKGYVLTPTAIGFMAAIGVARVTVIPGPRISIIVTGNELLKPGEDMLPGKVFEASSYALRAALAKTGSTRVAIHFVKDDPDRMSEVLWAALGESDMVLMTGGVSVGDHDHTAETAGRCGVEKIFHRVKQKPGKPLYFGMQGSKVFFGLPGNPSSVLTCFYEYVLTALKGMSGLAPEPVSIRAKLAGDQSKAKGLTQFLKAEYRQGVVTVLGAQESYKLNSFARANALLVFPEEQELLRAGSEVEVHLLP
jgi:molybdopterin molybdotransferase